VEEARNTQRDKRSATGKDHSTNCRSVCKTGENIITSTAQSMMSPRTIDVNSKEKDEKPHLRTFLLFFFLFVFKDLERRSLLRTLIGRFLGAFFRRLLRTLFGRFLGTFFRRLLRRLLRRFFSSYEWNESEIEREREKERKKGTSAKGRTK